MLQDAQAPVAEFLYPKRIVQRIAVVEDTALQHLGNPLLPTDPGRPEIVGPAQHVGDS